MNKIFKQWSNNLIPVELSADENGKKVVKPFKWKDGQTYSSFPRNSIALRTGNKTVNVIDMDTKDTSKLTEPFKTWIEDRLMLEDCLTVETANGFHFYFEGFLLRTSTKTGADKSEIPFIDFRGEGGLIFIHSTSEVANYEVICDETPTKNIADIIAYLPPYIEQEIIEDEEGFTNLDDETDTTVFVPNENGLKNREELEQLLRPISATTDRDSWMQLMASVFNMAENKQDSKQVCLEWSMTGKNFTEEGFDAVWKQIETKKYGRAFKGGTLVKTSNENREGERDEKFERYVEAIKKADTIDDIKNLFKKGDWKRTPLCSKAQQSALPSICKDRATVILKGSGEKISVAEFKPLIIMEEKKEAVDYKDIDKSTDAYIFDNKFHVVHRNTKLMEDVTKFSLYTTGNSLGYAGGDFESFVVNKAQVIQGIKKETDYMIEDEVTYELRGSNNPSEFDYLHVLTNPFFDVEEYTDRPDIIEDFFQNIWKGKAEDVIRLIGLTIRFKETKLNKIHLVAPSNTGKTTFLENLGFQTIHMKRLVQALNADKGIGKNIIDGLKASGFLLIDEANEPLTQDIKNIDNYIQLDQFGQGGTQDIKLHYTCLTSTHKNAIRNMSDEMYNRLLIIELGKDELDYTLDKSALFIKETDAYSKALTKHGKWILKDALINPKYKKKDLLTLQNKYRLELNSDIDDMLYEINERLVDTLKSQAGTVGDVIHKQDKYYIKRKKDLVGMIEDLLGEHGNIDVGKYTDVLISYMMPINERKKIKINGKPINYYELVLKPYYTSEDAEIIGEFDDLDMEFK